MFVFIREGLRCKSGHNIIKEYNLLVLKKLPLEEGVIPGAVRDHSVVVGRYRGAPAEDCDYLLERSVNG